MRNLIVILILLHVSIHIGVGLENFPDEIWEYITRTISKYGNQNPHIIEPYVTDQWQRNMTEPKLWQYLVPRLLLWDPLNQYPLLLENMISCPEHNSLLTAGNWRAKLSMQPRWIYDKGGAILLIMRTYVCKTPNSKTHWYLSGEATITEQLPQCLDVPFQLSHKAGFTEMLENDIVERLMAGVNFWHMENELKNGVANKYATTQRKHCIDLCTWQNISKSTEPHLHPMKMPEFELYLKCYAPIPSDSYLKEIFLNHYNSEVLSYKESFKKLSGNILSCNHTFKVSVNVGFVNPITKIWTTQYDSLFMILNEDGQVLGYEFVKSTAFSNIEHLLIELSNDEQNIYKDVAIIMLDNCCSWKKKISALFPEAEVKLDLFHAIQRITKHISMKNPFRKQLLRELRLVFRQKTDVKKERQESTPNTTDILKSFQDFLHRWQQVVDSDGTKILNEDTVKACKNLELHIRKGCLSNIPVGAGTNRNEKLHHFLNNSALAIGRIGPELAKAILCVLLYAWNCKRDPHKNNILFPIFSDFNIGTAKDICYYGIPVAKTETYSMMKENPSGTTFSSSNVISIDELEQKLIEKVCTFSKVVNSDIMKKGNFNIDASLWALNKKSIFLRNSPLDESKTSILCQNASKLGLTLIETLSDGNCLFHAIAYGLQNNTEKGKLSNIFQELNLSTDQQLAFHIRQAAVEEIKKNLHFYKDFCNNDEHLIVDRYKEDGTFDGNIGDLLLTAVSNMLQIPICIVTAREDVEVILVECSSIPVIDNPIFVAYDHSGPGHYCALAPTMDSNNQSSHLKTIDNIDSKAHKSCRCGRSQQKNDGNKKFCLKSRCPCFQNHISCTDACNCLMCSNPFGCRKSKTGNSISKGISRQRRKRHVTFQKQPGYKFLESNKEKIAQGKWSKTESFLLHQILICKQKRHGRPPTSITSTTAYNKTVTAITSTGIVVPVRHKTFKQIQQKQNLILQTSKTLKSLTNVL